MLDVVFDPREVTSRTNLSGVNFHRRMPDCTSVDIIVRLLILLSEIVVPHVQSSFEEASGDWKSSVVGGDDSVAPSNSVVVVEQATAPETTADSR